MAPPTCPVLHRLTMALSTARAILLAASVCLTPAGVLMAQTEAQDINFTNLEDWQKPWGEWKVAGRVRLDPDTPTQFVIQEGTGILVNGPEGRTGNLHSAFQHGDVQLHIEFCVPKDSNSGVYLQGRYEIQILDSWGKEDLKYGDCGGIYARHADGRDYEGHAPPVNASRPPGEWQSFDITFRAPRFDADGQKVEPARFVKVVHNGVTLHENVPVYGPTRAASWQDEKPLGPLMLQGDHGPVAYRNLRLQPLTP